MRSEWRVNCYKPDKAGIFLNENKVMFAAEIPTREECGVILYDQKGGEQRIPFSEAGRRGALYGLTVEGEGIRDCAYNYYQGDKVITDPYARGVKGLEVWGAGDRGRTTLGRIALADFDWQGDEAPGYPLEDCIIYGLNVRAFTMHKSSGVKKRGTFEGVMEKIPYLKELGITMVELMPCYEYEECLLPEKNMQQPKNVPEFETSKAPLRLNCWGFQKGFYFAPKASYSAAPYPENSFKLLVRELHKNGIEVMMQFYFPEDIGQLQMLEVIKFWVSEYHIDGVRVSGFHIPYRLFAQEPALRDTKIWCGYYPAEDLDVIASPVFKNFMADNENFRYDMRRYLKGDEGLMERVLHYHRRNPLGYGVVNYLADYEGFSLYDCVSYERKHNEENGEENRDGNDTNFTWNCGMEGVTRKKAVLDLRLKLLKNAVSFLFLSQGIPFLFSGDEFGNSRKGNNNCYCQDNETGWINWKTGKFQEELFAYTHSLIQLRKSCRILHMPQQLTGLDPKGCGAPDLSYHGTEAWRPDLSYISHMAGIALCGQYAEKEEPSLYIAYNMHWEPHKLALPKLFKDEVWVKMMDTAGQNEEQEVQEEEARETENQTAFMKDRSVALYRTKKIKRKPSVKRKGNKNRKKDDSKNESLETL